MESIAFVTPDYFYALALATLQFPDKSAAIFEGIDAALENHSSSQRCIFVLFADHFSRSSLADALLKIERWSSRAVVAIYENPTKPTLSVVSAPRTEKNLVGRSSRVQNVNQIVNAIEYLLSPAEGPISPSELTRSQLSIIHAIAAGRSNKEIAETREGSVRSVENLVARAMHRIGADDAVGVRARMLAAQNFLNPQAFND